MKVLPLPNHLLRHGVALALVMVAGSAPSLAEQPLIGAHLTSSDSQAAAADSWRRTLRSFPELDQRGAMIVPADIPRRGRTYRLLAKAETIEDAAALCRALKARGQYCQPMRVDARP